MDLRHTLRLEEADNYPSPEMIGHFPAGYVSIVASKPGCGKTWYTLYNLYTLSHDYRVGALIGDCPPNLIYDRVRRIANYANNDNIYVSFLSEILQIGHDIDLVRGVSGVEQFITKNSLRLIFLDTLVSFMGADESSQKDVTPIVKNLKNLAERTNCAIVLNHHLRKGSTNKEATEANSDDVIGSSILTRLTANVIIMKKQDGAIRAEFAKAWFTDNKPFTFKLVNLNGAITLMEGDNAGPMARSTQEQEITEYLKSRNPGYQFKIGDLAKSYPNITIKTWRDIFKKWLVTGFVKDLTPTETVMDKALQISNNT